MNETTHVSATFFTRVNIRSEEFAKRFYELLRDCNGILVPQEFDGGELTDYRWVFFDPTNPELAVRVWNQQGSVLMRRREPMETWITFTMLFLAGGKFNTGSISVEERYFESPDHLATFLDLCLALYDLLHPAYGRVHQVRDDLDTSTVVDPRYGRTTIPTDLGKGLPGVYWANFLGPEYVAMLGRERLLSAPCFQLQELPDRGLLILTSQSPLRPSSADNRRAQRGLRKFLGEDVFYPSQAESTRVPQFRFEVPSSASGKGLGIDFALNSKEQRAKAQNLIDNAEEFAFLLIDECAGQGIELDQSLESLRTLDQILLQRRKKGKTLDEFTAKMIAAYAGEVARRTLDGHWVVDKVTGEAAMQVEDARIFPLARVFKFWESEEEDAFTTLLCILKNLAPDRT